MANIDVGRIGHWNLATLSTLRKQVEHPLSCSLSTTSERLPVHRSVSFSWAIERRFSTGNMYLLHHM